MDQNGQSILPRKKMEMKKTSRKTLTPMGLSPWGCWSYGVSWLSIKRCRAQMLGKMQLPLQKESQLEYPSCLVKYHPVEDTGRVVVYNVWSI